VPELLDLTRAARFEDSVPRAAIFEDSVPRAARFEDLAALVI